MTKNNKGLLVKTAVIFFLLLFFLKEFNESVCAFELIAECDTEVIAGQRFYLTIYYVDDAGNVVDANANDLLDGQFILRSTGDDNQLEPVIIPKTNFVDNKLKAAVRYNKSGVISLILIDNDNGLITRTGSIIVKSAELKKCSVILGTDTIKVGAEFEIKLIFSDENDNVIPITEIFENREITKQSDYLFAGLNERDNLVLREIKKTDDALIFVFYTEIAGRRDFAVIDKIQGRKLTDISLNIEEEQPSKIEIKSDTCISDEGYLNFTIDMFDKFNNKIEKAAGFLNLKFSSMEYPDYFVEKKYENIAYIKDIIKLEKISGYEIDCEYVGENVVIKTRKKIGSGLDLPLSKSSIKNALMTIKKSNDFMVECNLKLFDYNDSPMSNLIDNVILKINNKDYLIDRTQIENFIVLNEFEKWEQISADLEIKNIKKLNNFLLLKTKNEYNYKIILCFSGKDNSLEINRIENNSGVTIKFDTALIMQEYLKENINDKIKKIKIFNNYMILETADNFEISNMLFEKKLNVYIIDFELIKREAIKEHNDYLKDYALSRNLKLTDLSKIYDLEFEKIEDKKLKEKILN